MQDRLMMCAFFDGGDGMLAPLGVPEPEPVAAPPADALEAIQQKILAFREEALWARRDTIVRMVPTRILAEINALVAEAAAMAVPGRSCGPRLAAMRFDTGVVTAWRDLYAPLGTVKWALVDLRRERNFAVWEARTDAENAANAGVSGRVMHAPAPQA